MQDIPAFRKYYNDYLHTELLNFERRRKRLVWLILILCSLLGILSGMVISLGVVALSFFLAIPWYVLIQFLRGKIFTFRDEFKPMVVNAILKFIDPTLKYYHKDFIPEDTFNRARIFPIRPEIYKGEDYIMGKIGEVFFELCELEIYHTANLEGKLVRWFEGIFFHANFHNKFQGRILLVPRPEWQHFIPLLKQFAKYGGGEIKGLGDETFQKEFIVYAEKNVPYKEVLSPTLLKTINAYHLKSKKQVYVSFVDSHFYIAIAEPYELLEAHIFFSNLDFELICMFYQELYMFTRLVEDFDIRK